MRCSLAILGREEGKERVACRPSADAFDSLLPALRLLDAVADEGDEQGGRNTRRKHGPPSQTRAENIVESRSKKNSDVVARIEIARSRYSASTGQFLGYEHRGSNKLPSDPEAGQKTEHAKLPYVLRDAA